MSITPHKKMILNIELGLVLVSNSSTIFHIQSNLNFNRLTISQSMSKKNGIEHMI